MKPDWEVFANCKWDPETNEWEMIDTFRNRLAELGVKLGGEAVIYGVIEEYRQSVATSSGTFPEVSLSVRMVDTGQTVKAFFPQ